MAATEPAAVTDHVRRQTLDQTVLATGVIRPEVGAEIDVGSRVSGIVSSLPVKVGNRVDRGDLLARIDPTDIPVTTAMRRLSDVEHLDRIYVQAESEEAISSVRADVASLLRRRHFTLVGGSDDFVIKDQTAGRRRAWCVGDALANGVELAGCRVPFGYLGCDRSVLRCLSGTPRCEARSYPGAQQSMTTTPREPIRVTADELASVGIDYRSDDLFTGCSRSDDQPPVHFGLARLTESNLAFWRRYRSSSGLVADLLTRLAVKLRRPDERLDFDELAETYGWSRGELERVADAIRRRGYAERKIFRNVKGGVIGFEWLLDGNFAQTEDRFAAYASREPILAEPATTLPDRTAEPAVQMREHEARYSELLLTVGVATERGLPTVTHFGIFRNPLAFLDPEPAHRGLAMQLHGFVATVSLHAFSDKHYMVTNPMPEMTRILRRALAPEDIHQGDSDAGVRRYLNRNLPSGAPPIREDQRYSYAGFTLDARPTVVKLKALAPYYRPAEPGLLEPLRCSARLGTDDSDSGY